MAVIRWTLAFAVLTACLLAVVAAVTLRSRPIAAQVRLDSAPAAALPSGDAPQPLRVAAAAMLAPVNSYRVHHALGHYLAHALGRPLEMVTAGSYAEVNAALRRGAIDVAFVCSGGFAAGRDAMDVIAVPIRHGEATYRAALIVHADSPAQSLADLRGRRVVCSDPLSNSGCWHLQRAAQRLAGATPFFADITYTGSHERSIHAVASGATGGATVGTIFLEDALARNPALPLRVLSLSEPIPNPPVVVRKGLPTSLRDRLQRALVALEATADGRAVLREMRADGFRGATNEEFRGVVPP